MGRKCDLQLIHRSHLFLGANKCYGYRDSCQVWSGGKDHCHWGYFGMRCKKGRSFLNDRALEGSAEQLTSCQYLQSRKGTDS